MPLPIAHACIGASIATALGPRTFTSRLAPGPELFWPVFSRRYSAGFVDYFDFSIKVRGPFEFSILILKISLVEAVVFIPLFLIVRLIAHAVRTRNLREAPIEPQEVG